VTLDKIHAAGDIMPIANDAGFTLPPQLREREKDIYGDRLPFSEECH
jgi:hypothetical protein